MHCLECWLVALCIAWNVGKHLPRRLQPTKHQLRTHTHALLFFVCVCVLFFAPYLSSTLSCFYAIDLLTLADGVPISSQIRFVVNLPLGAVSM